MPVAPPPLVDGCSPVVWITTTEHKDEIYAIYDYVRKKYYVGHFVLPKIVVSWRPVTESELLIYQRQMSFPNLPPLTIQLKIEL